MSHSAQRPETDAADSLYCTDSDSPQGRTTSTRTASSSCSNDATVALLLQHGAAVDALDSEGWTPLHTAAAAGRVTCAWRLLSSGHCNAVLTTASGRTALHIAAAAGCTDVVRLLARWDADRGVLQGVRDEAGKTPLDLARSDEVSKLLHLV
jgi:uncharacterized protein